MTLQIHARALSYISTPRDVPLPVATYNFDEASGAILDVTGGGKDITFAGGLSRVAGESGHGTALATSNGTVDGPATLFGQTPQRTLMMRLKTQADFTGWIFEWHDNTGDTGYWGLLCLSGQLGFRARNAASTTAFAAITRPTDNAWHHWCGTFDGTIARLYLDGVFQTQTSVLAGGIDTAAPDLIRLFTTLSGTQTIDDVRIFTECLTAAEISGYVTAPVTSSGGSHTLSVATGTNTALALTASNTATLSMATGTGVASALVASGTAVLSRATETDAAAVLSVTKTVTLSAATETDTARVVIAGDAMTLFVSAEADTVAALSVTKTVNLSLATESDSARVLVAGGSATLSRATETDAGPGLSTAKTVTVGRATETDVTAVLSVAKTITLGVASETDTALVAAVGQIQATTLSRATETDTAQTAAISAKTTVLSRATETETVNTLNQLASYVLGRPTEAETAFGMMVSARRFTLGMASESDTAYAVGDLLSITRTLSTATEADVTQVLAVAKNSFFARATTTEAAPGLSASMARSWVLSLAAETDTAITAAIGVFDRRNITIVALTGPVAHAVTSNAPTTAWAASDPTTEVWTTTSPATDWVTSGPALGPWTTTEPSL